ncbi:MAG: nucleotide exchange factor GrpE [Candidatus Epulonipiscioides saccharophilum]|nr:MAG: nucleotide exchange factor GrpE [Epulopiscium sp. AS2M-Bin001]
MKKKQQKDIPAPEMEEILENVIVEEPEKTAEPTMDEEEISEDQQNEHSKENDPKVVNISDKASKDHNLEKLQRLMAEFDNYRKRTEKEKSMVYDMAVSSIVTDLLGIIDNFERALKQETSDQAFYDGVSMIYKQLIATLDKIGIKVIETEGQEFNPKLHNAIFHIEDDNLPKNYIVEELQKGYTFKDKVLRHSLVKVAN